MEHHDHAKEAIEAIDKCLSTPPPTIEEAIHEAEERHVYTHEEAQLYIDAYRRCFLKSKEIYPEE